MSGAHRSQTLTALTLVGLAIVASASPSPATIMTRDLSVNITVCTAPDACSIVPGQSGIGGCTDLLDHFSFLFKEITSATIPDGFACTFHEILECATFPGDSIFLTPGTWDFSDVITADGVLGFDDQTSLLTCSTL